MKGVVLLRRHRIDEYMKNAIRDITLQRLKNEAEFCPDSKDNPRCLMEDEQNSTKYFYRCDLYSDGLLHGETKSAAI